MSNLNEHGFETAICTELAARGWVYEDGARDAGFDPEFGLFPSDVLEWLESQYPNEYARVCPPRLDDAATKAAQHRMLKYLAGLLAKTPQRNHTKGGTIGGLLSVLRDGFSYMSAGNGKATFGPMVGFYPTNPSLTNIVKKAQGT